MITRRRILCSATGAAISALAARVAVAGGRVAYGGDITMHVPWPTGSIDPHRIDDATAALFGEALFDTLYAPGERGAIVASLAADDPVAQGDVLRVPLRRGIRFASGTLMDPRAVAASIARARARDASAWLAAVPIPRLVEDGLLFRTRDAEGLVRALASPLVAIVPPQFSAERPEGTGPFRVEPLAGGLRLARNGFASNGPPYLDAIDIHGAPDLVTSLRAFESGLDDLGWLGSFLHEPRSGARRFDGGAVAWAILRTGKHAGNLDAPGLAQALADGVPHSALASFVVGPAWEQGDARWTGPPVELLVRDDAPWLVEVARALAVALSTASHEITARPLAWPELVQRRSRRAFALMLDLARPAGPGSLGALIGLATADDPVSAASLATHPPRGDIAPRTATRTMRVGVVCEVRVEGGRAPDVALPVSPRGRGIDWGSASRTRRAS